MKRPRTQWKGFGNPLGMCGRSLLSLVLFPAVVLLVADFVPGMAAQDQLPAVEAEVDLETIRVGDRLTMTVTVTPGTRGTFDFEQPEPRQRFGAFELQDFRVLESKRPEEILQRKAQFVLTAFEVGELEIPPLRFEVTAEDDSGEVVTLETSPIPILVESLQPDEASDIRDLKPQLSIPRNWWLLLPWVLAAALLIVAAVWAIRRFRGRSGDASEPVNAVPARPAHEVAYEALDRLESEEYPKKGETKRHFSEVSEIVRVYLEGRFGLVALEMTTSELLDETAKIRLGRPQTGLLQDFLNRCDLVKFAKYRPEIQTSQKIVPLARSFVDQTHVVEVRTTAGGASITDGG